MGIADGQRPGVEGPGWFKMRPAGVVMSCGLGRQSHKLFRSWVWSEESQAMLGKGALFSDE